MEKKLRKFEPIGTTALTKIEELLKRGGTLVNERSTFVEVKRMQSVARIDQFGRVEWRPV